MTGQATQIDAPTEMSGCPIAAGDPGYDCGAHLFNVMLHRLTGGLTVAGFQCIHHCQMFLGNFMTSRRLSSEPEHELALVTTAAVPGSISRPDIGIPPLVWEYLPSLIAGADSSSESELSLTRYTQSRSLSLGGVDVPDNQACTVNGLRFKAESNADDICAIRIDFNGSSCCVQFEYRHHTHSINAGLDGTHVESTTTLPGAGLHHGYEPGQLATVAWGYWHEPNVFTLKCQYIETAFCDTFIFAFDKGVLNMQRSVNVNGGNTQRPIIRAQAEDPAMS